VIVSKKRTIQLKYFAIIHSIFREGSEGVPRAFRGPFEGVRRAKALGTPSEPPIKPLPFLIRPKMEVSG